MKLKFGLDKLSRFPWSLGFALGMMVFFSFHPEWHGDLLAFREYAETLWHPYWARWLFQLLAYLAEPIAYIGLSLTCTAMLYLSVKVFGGRHWMVFTSFAFAWTLIYGQIDGLVAGGLAISWWALREERPVLIGVGITLATIKPQLSLPVALAIWWWSPSRMKSLIVPGIVLLATLFEWGWWIPAWFERVFDTQYLVSLSRNISLWPVVGPWILLIWPFILSLDLPREKKLLAISIGTAMTMPYFPLPSSVVLLAFPVPVWSWVILQIPMFGSVVGYSVYRLGVILPPALLIWVAWPELERMWSRLTRMVTSV